MERRRFVYGVLAAGLICGAAYRWWKRVHCRSSTVIIPGLTLFQGILTRTEQEEVLQHVDDLLLQGRKGLLQKSYAPVPDKFANRHQSREMIQFGVYTHSNRVEDAKGVLLMPDWIITIVDKMQEHGIFLPTQRPEACTINCYCKGDWLPPHVDNKRFDRPFATLSIGSVQQAVFGTDISSTDTPGVFTGGTVVDMPLGSVLRVDGYAANECFHAIPAATDRRISLTFRRLTPATKQSFKNLHPSIKAS